MDNHNLEIFDDGDFNENSQRKRPPFIVVLAILSWIFVAFGVLGGIFSSFSSAESQTQAIDKTIEIYEEADDMPMQQDLIDFMVASRNNIRLSNLGYLILGLIEGIAVFMMFNLKKIGFWIYTLTQIGYLGLMFYILPFPNVMSTMMLVFYIFIILIFEVLYAVNLKHMKN